MAGGADMGYGHLGYAPFGLHKRYFKSLFNYRSQKSLVPSFPSVLPIYICFLVPDEKPTDKYNATYYV